MPIVSRTMAIIICFLWAGWHPSSAQAQQILFSDDFTQQNVADWVLQINAQYDQPSQPCLMSNQPAEWELLDGRFGITIRSSPPCSTVITPANLDLQTVAHYQLEFDWFFPETMNMDRNIILSWQDQQNWMGIKLLNQLITVEKVVNGKIADIYNNWASIQLEPDEEHHFLIDVNQNLITLHINGEEILQTLNFFPHLKGPRTFGLKGSTGAITYSRSYFDNIVLTSLDDSNEKRLDIPYFSQADPQWKNMTYDTASAWTTDKPTIERWGCALTSAVMVLKYYGIDQMSDVLELTPLTLNYWLQTQSDGYLGNGLVNWIAVTRLTQEMNSLLNTPVLEFSSFQPSQSDSDSPSHQLKNKMVEQVDLYRPVITHIPDHFYITSGYTSDKQNFYISDPAFSYQLASQHATTPDSLRLFTPSHTDLSYLVIVADEKVEIKLTSLMSTNQEHAQSNLSKSGILESITAIDGSLISQTPPVFSDTITQQHILYFPKPKRGDYLIEASSPSFEHSTLTIYSYSSTAELLNTHMIEFSKNYFGKLTYFEDKESTLTSTTNFYQFEQQIEQFYLNQEITVRYVFLRLRQLAQFAQQYPQMYQRYQQLLKSEVLQFSSFISKPAQEQLLQLLK